MSAPDGDETGRTVLRFVPSVRLVHAVTGVLTIICIATAAILYNGPLAVLVGHRYLVEQAHVVAGLALPVAPVLGLVSRGYRSDVGRLDRFTPEDWRWLRSRNRRDGSFEVGKFNAGQKLNASVSAGSIAALLLSGTCMYLTGLAPLPWRSGATFVHDWFALGFGLLVVGHITYALRDPEAMTGIRTGRVLLWWARRQHPAWAREVAGRPGRDALG